MPPELEGRLDLEHTVDAKDSFVVDVDVMIPIQLVPDSSVSHVRVGLMDFFHLVCDVRILLLAAAFGMFEPTVIR